MPRTIRALPVLIANSHIVPAWATQDNLGKWVRER